MNAEKDELWILDPSAAKTRTDSARVLFMQALIRERRERLIPTHKWVCVSDTHVARTVKFDLFERVQYRLEVVWHTEVRPEMKLDASEKLRALFNKWKIVPPVMQKERISPTRPPESIM